MELLMRCLQSGQREEVDGGGRGVEREEAAVGLSYGLSQCVLPKLISSEKTVNPKPYLHCGIHKETPAFRISHSEGK